ncbi:MAG: D-aminoacyl-tRNA deacylase [Candidatus Micrarchaeota archaeon]
MFNKISIIVSKTDPAGLNISNHLIKEFNFEKTEKSFDSNPIYSFSAEKTKQEFSLIFIEQKQVFADYLNELETDLFVFASKHSSESKTPTLSVHPIGNFSSADLGGKPKTLIPTSSLVLKNFFLNLVKNAKSNSFPWPVLLEQTHHGPFLSKPTVFIEIGSSEEQWSDEKAGKILAQTIMNSFENFNPNFKTALGVGGTHYCPEFSKIEERTEIALSHILSKYYIDAVDLSLFKQMIEKTSEKTDLVLLDWKGLISEQRKKIISFCKELNLEYRRTRDFL